MKAQTRSIVRETAIVMEWSDLEDEGSQIIARARAEAARLIETAEAAATQEAPAIREAARAAGHEEGLRLGLEAGKQAGHTESAATYAQALLDLTTRWSQTLDLLHQSMPAHAADAKTDLIRLALAIADRVAHGRAAVNDEVVRATVEETLKMVGSARAVALRVNPTEIDMLERYLPDLLAKIRSIESAKLTADESVTPGGCVVQFGAGQIDARLETQIARITDELLAGETGS